VIKTPIIVCRLGVTELSILMDKEPISSEVEIRPLFERVIKL